jgi:hypothetical protein
MKPEEMQELREFVDNLAKGRTENKDCTILIGINAIEVRADIFNEFDDFLDDRINKMVQDAIFTQKGEEYEQTKRNAMQLFLYTFAKTFEAFYYMLQGRNYEIQFYLMAAVEWEGNDDSAPLCVQNRILDVEPRLMKIASLTYNFVEERGYVNQPLDKWLYEYLYSASHLAKQYMLEQEWNC